MAIHKLSLAGIEKVRQYLHEALVIPELENHPRKLSLAAIDDDLPEPTSLDALGDLFRAASSPEDVISAPNLEGRWFLSAASPSIIFAKLPGLRLKPKIRLVTYLLRFADRGIGQTWAVPEERSTTAELEEALVVGRDGRRSTSDRGQVFERSRSHPPKPAMALADPMMAVEGDQLPTSYVVASLVSRELKEFGAIGEDMNWSHHRLITIAPTKVKWDWEIEVPQDLAPKVRVFEEGRAAVEFFTCRVVTPVGIYRHLDQYTADSYAPRTLDRVVAAAHR
jgi:hypothetical protein